MATKITRATARDYLKAAEWPTVTEVAQQYNVPRRWLQDQIGAGRVRAIRINVLRVDPEDFVRFLDALNAK